MEWMYDIILNFLYDSRFIVYKYLEINDKMYFFVLNISRFNLLESM